MKQAVLQRCGRHSPPTVLGALPGPVHLSATGLLDDRRSADAPGLGFRLGLVDATLHWPLPLGTAGLGASWQDVSVASEPLRRTAAAHLDWTPALPAGRMLALRLELARQRHAAALSDLDAEVLQLSAHGQPGPAPAPFDGLDLGAGVRVERNRRGLPELGSRSVYLMADLGWPALGAAWSLSGMLQRAVFGAAAGPDLPARRDSFMAVDLSAQWPLGPRVGLRVQAGISRNRAQPWLYANRQQQVAIGLNGRW